MLGILDGITVGCDDGVLVGIEDGRLVGTHVGNDEGNNGYGKAVVATVSVVSCCEIENCWCSEINL